MDQEPGNLGLPCGLHQQPRAETRHRHQEFRGQAVPDGAASHEHAGPRRQDPAGRVAETREAVEIYNKLAGDCEVGGLFHSTC